MCGSGPVNCDPEGQRGPAQATPAHRRVLHMTMRPAAPRPSLLRERGTGGRVTGSSFSFFFSTITTAVSPASSISEAIPVQIRGGSPASAAAYRSMSGVRATDQADQHSPFPHSPAPSRILSSAALDSVWLRSLSPLNLGRGNASGQHGTAVAEGIYIAPRRAKKNRKIPKISWCSDRPPPMNPQTGTGQSGMNRRGVTRPVRLTQGTK
ncbi:MAG: hypothetical protein JWO38_6285 [Gemmataceae bacterium]|nr:hypothetical protein [Gemmataceae bacterium]